MRYQVAGGKIVSGLTRGVWELEQVVAGQGGTTGGIDAFMVHYTQRMLTEILYKQHKGL